jgi:hypothetical protein
MHILKKQSVYIKFCFTLKKCYGNFRNIQSSFWRADQRKNTSFQRFSNVKRSVASVKDARHLRHFWTSKTHENGNQMMKLVFENRQITIQKVAITFETTSSKSGTLNHKGKQSTDSMQAGFICCSTAILRAEISETFCITTNLTRNIIKNPS